MMSPSSSSRDCLILVLLCFTPLAPVFSKYKTVYLEDTCKSNETLRIILGDNDADSAEIIKASTKPTSLPNRNCTIYILPPLGHGITLSIRYLNMNPFTEPQCENYVLITDVQGPENEVMLCSHSNDVTEFQSYTANGCLKLLFHTENADHMQFYFTFVVTAFQNVPTGSIYCPLNWFKCDNNHCIWKGLTCDGHNNCGDQSDERRFAPSSCDEGYSDGTSSGLIIGISLGSLFLFLLVVVLPLVYCFKRLKDQQRALNEERRLLHDRPRTLENREHEGRATTSYQTQSTGAGNGTYQDQPPAYKP